MEVYFTKHAIAKFRVLKDHGVTISRQKVLRTLQSPEAIDYGRLPLFIAQRDLDEAHVLRVVYKKEDDIIIVITFYPGRKNQYVKQ